LLEGYEIGWNAKFLLILTFKKKSPTARRDCGAKGIWVVLRRRT